MQCSRCFFENPADARWCGYCGHAFAAAAPAESSSSAQGPAQKRETRLGVVPEDPFAAVAAGLRGGAALTPVPPPPAPIPQRAVPPSRAPAVEERPSRRARRARHQATVVDGLLPDEPDRAELIGVIVVMPEGAEPSPQLLRAGQRRIGREPDNDICIDDPRASGHHAILRAEPGSVWLLDTSTNGTVVNGTRIRADRAPLADGSVIELGRTLIVVQLFADDTLAILRGSQP